MITCFRVEKLKMNSDKVGDNDNKVAKNEQKMSNKKLIIAVLGSSVGNVMEWFDFAMYVNGLLIRIKF